MSRWLQANYKRKAVDATPQHENIEKQWEAEQWQEELNKPAIVETVEEDFVRNIPNVINEEVSKYVDDLVKMLDVDPEQFREESFKNKLLDIVNKLKEDPEVNKHINYNFNAFRPLSNVSLGENYERINILHIINKSNLSQNAKTNLTTVYESLIDTVNDQEIFVILMIIALMCGLGVTGIVIGKEL